MTEPTGGARLPTLDLHERAGAEFDRRVRAVGPAQWADPTPCRDWDVRALVNHLVVEQLWVPPLMDGRSIADVGDAFDGDQLGDDPVAAWELSARAARAAFTAPGALDRSVELSYGEVPAEHYCRQMAHDLLIHAWDLARGMGADDRLDPDAVATAYADAAPHADQLASSGLFDPRVDVPADADPQTRLLAMFGRRR